MSDRFYIGVAFVASGLSLALSAYNTRKLWWKYTVGARVVQWLNRREDRRRGV